MTLDAGDNSNPAMPPEYMGTVDVVKRIIDVWRADARPGERTGDWLHKGSRSSTGG
ncbi:hypothetical protein [Pyrobaculum ferrireducens]|uniref:Uncharacterized protein n=1 Tax=Pyrobaculum ferrireducens TaxID=1104324 RepID=G7VE39_9CREN|nr:hypothetical protein [Pyrobaculum ferrireducens]AET32812.1 hypothetical protein P186_1385 [Pyrobaculum ferrireducens]